MKKTLFKGHALQMALLTCLAMIFGLAGSTFAQHPPVDLLDGNGQPVPAITGAAPAYSAAETCGGCHHYDEIEQHSYHAQIGANQMVGWAAWNPNSPSKFKKGVAAKGKNWVQSPGHVGKW